MSDSTTTIADLKQLVRDFVDRRDWRQFHAPKNLAMSLSIEAAELMEHFQWISADELRRVAGDPARLAAVGEELADVLCYALAMSNELGLDLATAIGRKSPRTSGNTPSNSTAAATDRKTAGSDEARMTNDEEPHHVCRSAPGIRRTDGRLPQCAACIAIVAVANVQSAGGEPTARPAGNGVLLCKPESACRRRAIADLRPLRLPEGQLASRGLNRGCLVHSPPTARDCTAGTCCTPAASGRGAFLSRQRRKRCPMGRRVQNPSRSPRRQFLGFRLSRFRPQ